MNRWDDLRVFLAVARHGTLTAASEELAVSASTLHRQLARFEEQERIPLFRKGPRGYELTTAGMGLLPKAEEVEEAVLAATSALRGHDRDAVGEVRLTLSNDLLPMAAPHLLAFTATCPKITVVTSVRDAIVELGTQADVAFRISPTPPEDAVGRKIGPIAWAVYGGEGGWIGYQGFDALKAGTASLYVDTVSAMHSLLLCTDRCGWLPCFVGDATEGLRRQSEPQETPDELWVLIHADLRRSARVRAFIDFMVPKLLEERGRLLGQPRRPPISAVD